MFGTLRSGGSGSDCEHFAEREDARCNQQASNVPKHIATQISNSSHRNVRKAGQCIPLAVLAICLQSHPIAGGTKATLLLVAKLANANQQKQLLPQACLRQCSTHFPLIHTASAALMIDQFHAHSFTTLVTLALSVGRQLSISQRAPTPRDLLFTISCIERSTSIDNTLYSVLYRCHGGHQESETSVFGG